MATYKCQASLQAVSGVSADLHVNTFYIETDDWSQQLAQDWGTLIETFYTEIKPAMLNGYQGDSLLLKQYDLETTNVPNYPVYEWTGDVGAPSVAFTMPPEIALCVSYRNVTYPNVPRARRRGRIYIGGHTEQTNGLDGRPEEDACVALRDAFRDYVTAVRALSGSSLPVIYSPTQFGAAYPIEEVYVDNEWDIQRRRGREATNTYTTGVF